MLTTGSYRYSYKSQRRKTLKRRLGLGNGVTQDHHVIPQQWKNHPVFDRIDYPINDRKNVVIMPSYHKQCQEFNVSSNRMIHNDGHHKYNTYVKSVLDLLYTIESNELLEFEFKRYVDFLKTSLRTSKYKLPWQ